MSDPGLFLLGLSHGLAALLLVGLVIEYARRKATRRPEDIELRAENERLKGVIHGLRDETVKLREGGDECWSLLKTRAGKLLLKGKPFIVVAIDEPYYAHVYRLIRKHETHKGTWTEEDEVEYRVRTSEWVQKEAINERESEGEER
jgi:hypothetical protein